MKKLGKEIRLENLDGFRADYGTINSKDPKAIYLNLYSWIKPTEEMDWFALHRKMEHLIKQVLYENLENTNYTRKRRIIDIDLHINSMEKNKSSFMNINITLFTKNKDKKFPNNIYSEPIPLLQSKIINKLHGIKGLKFNTTK